MSTIEIKKISITDLDTEIITNAANDGLWAGTGVCGAIFDAAGHDELKKACDAIGHCDTGSAVITPGFKLKAKYIVHAVGPVYNGGNHGEKELLAGAYRKSLELAKEYQCSSIGFPLISAGVFGYPLEDAWDTAIHTCKRFLQENPEYEIDIVFAVLDQNIFREGNRILHEIASEYCIAKKEDWTTVEMPEEHDTFILYRHFTDHQMKTLRNGHIPQEMEDKWFWYMEGNTLYAHRSWTGFCIFVVELSDSDDHKVTVNRYPEQYTCTSVEEDRQKLNDLLDGWTKPKYNFFNAWLTETMNNLARAGKTTDTLRVGDREVEAVYFHKPEEPYGFLSNWYPSVFTVDGIQYSSVEQYIMYQKCMIFNDQDSAQAVMDTDDVALQQAIGRNAKGYNDMVWAGARQALAMRGLYAKFTQNEDLKEKLLSTGAAWLVECARSDIFWACGISLQDEKRKDTSNWRGKNLLGFALMEVRKTIEAEEYPDE